MVDVATAEPPVAAPARHAARRIGLFRKYLALLVALVGSTFVVSNLLYIYRLYHENTSNLLRLQRETALATAAAVENVITDLQRQLGLAIRSPWAARTELPQGLSEQYRRLFPYAPSIARVNYLDASGIERLSVSRIAPMGVVTLRDFSDHPVFTETRRGVPYVGQLEFHPGHDPTMVIAMPRSGWNQDVTVAEINLRFVSDIVSKIKLGPSGQAFVVDSSGSLVAHPDAEMVRKQVHLDSIGHVLHPPNDGDSGSASRVDRNTRGEWTLSAYAVVKPLGWKVYAEQPLQEALKPLYVALVQNLLLAFLALVGSVVAALVLARRMVVPIAALERGAARIADGDLRHRIEIRTGDELETLAIEFNNMAGRLDELYSNLERKVAERTRELARVGDELSSHLLRVESELTTAREIQLAMVRTDFPAALERHVQLFATLQPARKVGGDFYDFFEDDDGRLCLVIGDVSDKGMAAALFMARTHALIRFAPRLLRQPGGRPPTAAEILAHVNAELCLDNSLAMFATVIFAVVEPSKRRISFCNAGHTPPFLVRGCGRAVRIDSPRTQPVGVTPRARYEESFMDIEPGDTLFMFTDGVTEATNPREEFFSEARLANSLGELAGEAPQSMVQGVVERVRAFSENAPPADDIAALALRLAPRSVGDVTISADNEGIAAVARLVDEIAATHGLEPEALADIHVALDEVLANIVQHALPSRPEDTIDVRFSLYDREFEIQVEDSGPPFDPLGVPAPDLHAPLAERAVGGLGVHFVKKLMDRVFYRRAGNHNRLVLHRRLARSDHRGNP